MAEILPYKESDPSNSQVVLVLGESSTPSLSSFRSSRIESEVPSEHVVNVGSPGTRKNSNFEDPSNAVTPKVDIFKGRINSAVAIGGGAGIINSIADNLRSFSRQSNVSESS